MIGPVGFFQRRLRPPSRPERENPAQDVVVQPLLESLDLRAVGRPEDEADAERCLIKGEVLLRSGRSDAAQLFLRQAPRLAASRQIAAALTLRSASQDFVFQRLIEAADRSRDAKKWAEAADLYCEALGAYPEHYGYLVQYAHCLKEQEEYAEAECHYRSALALGAPPADVDEHLAFVLLRQEEQEEKEEAAARIDGRRRRRRTIESEPPPAPVPTADELFDAPPTKADVDLLVGLLFGRRARIDEVVQLLRRHRTVRSLFIELAEENAFSAVNVRLLSQPWRTVGDR